MENFALIVIGVSTIAFALLLIFLSTEPKTKQEVK
jgi:multisubunit Na+/H+ antiporter MnhC subunit